MTIAERIGTARYFQSIGQGYADMARGSMTASGLVTAGAAWLGMSKSMALALGAASVCFWVLLAVVFGYVVWRWRVVHHSLGMERDANPATVRTLELLERIERNTRR